MKAYKIIAKIERWIWQFKKLPYLYPMKVKFMDNEKVVEVTGPVELINWMRLHSFDITQSNHEYMMNYCRRAVLMDNLDISAVNEITFFNDLVKHNLIEIIEE